MEFDNVETVKRAVEINAGIAILPQTVTRRSTGTTQGDQVQEQDLQTATCAHSPQGSCPHTCNEKAD